MSDVRSALSGVSASGAVHVEESGLVGMITIRGDLSAKSFQDAFTAETGVAVPTETARSAKGDNALLWMSPDELLLTCPHGAASDLVDRLEKALSGEHNLVVDVSDARAVFIVSGVDGAVRDTLAKLTPADLRAGSLPLNVVRRTRLAQVPAAIWFESEGNATIVCFRSVARYVFDLLRTSAKPGGEVGHFA